MKNFISKNKLPVILFLVALAARIILFSINFTVNDGELVPTIKGDDGYYELSQSLRDGRGFTWDTEPPYRSVALRPPVWPYLIAFFLKIFGSYWAVFALEIILGSFIPVLAYFIGRRLFGHRAGKWTGLIMCFEPYLVLFSFILYTETSFIFFFLISLVFLLRYLETPALKSAVWFAVFLALATLIKPTVQYLPILIPLGLLIIWRKSLSREHLKHLGAFAIVFIVLIFPWLYRNKTEFGAWGISAQPAFNLYVYLVPTVLSIDNGTSFQTELDSFIGKDFDPLAITLANSSEYRDKAIDVLKGHKTALIKSGLTTLVTFFTHDGMLTVFGYSDVRFENVISKPVIYLLSDPIEFVKTVYKYSKSPAVVIIIMRFFWILVTLFFLFGAWKFFKNEKIQAKRLMGTLAVCLILYFTVTTAINGLGVNARFKMPVDVFILGFALYGLFSLKRDNTSITSA